MEKGLRWFVNINFIDISAASQPIHEFLEIIITSTLQLFFPSSFHHCRKIGQM